MPKLPNWALILLLGAIITLPRLGSFGLWDPSEIRQADVARDVAESGSWADPTIKGKYGPRPVLYVWLVAAGFKLFGVNELAGRLPLALFGLLGLMLAYYLGRRLEGEAAAVGAAFVLITTPIYLFVSRQLVSSEIPYYVALLASIGGFAAYLWPVDGTRRTRDLAIGGVGLAIGFVARGALLGLAFPLLCLALTLALGWTISGRDDPADEEQEPPAGLGPSIGRAVRAHWPSLLGAVLVALALCGLVAKALGGKEAGEHLAEYLLLGGTVHKLSIPPTFDRVIRDLGFACFPWSALAPLALAGFVVAQGHRGRPAFLRLLVVVTVSLGYVVAVVWPGYLGKLHYPALPWLLFGVGVWAAGVARSGEVRPAWGLVAAAVVLALQQDFYMRPESLAFAHLLKTPKYPVELDLKYAVRVFGIGLAVLYYFALSGPPRPFVGRVELEGKGWLGRVLRRVYHFIALVISNLGRAVDGVGGLLRSAAGERNRNYWIGVAALTVVFAGWCTLYLTSALSRHMSNKALFQTYHRCRRGDERLAQYQVSGRAAAYYNDGQIDQVRHQRELFQLLRRPQRAFVLLPASRLAPVDQAARRQRLPYFVLDDSNSKFLIISNKLSGACTEDLNPLRKLVVSQRPHPKKTIRANWENRVELIGYDLPDEVHRGSKFKITLYFKVLGRMPPGYKIFIHFDKPASRFHGDHKPLGDKYPTQYWLPGDYVIDPHEVDIPRLTTPSGRYTIYMGFWLGSKRLKVTSGPHGGGNRVILGKLRVR